MPSSDNWSSQSSDNSRNIFDGRIRSWNNTPNFGTVPKDSRPINGYSDQTLRASQLTYFQITYQWTDGIGWQETVRVEDFRYPLGTVITASGGTNSAYRSDFESSTSSMLNDLTVKALVKIADAKVNLAVAYAEASKTSDLILDTARRIDRAYRAFRKGDLRGIAQNLNITPKRLHKSWLEYKYGWMPLLMDVKGAAEFFAQQHVIRPPRFKVSTTASFTKTYSQVLGYTPVSGAATLPVPELFSATRDMKVAIWCELSSPHLSELQQLGLTNPALVVWELIPFSFVFDWFVSVGDWLTGLTALQGVTVLRMFTSKVTKYGSIRNYPSFDLQRPSQVRVIASPLQFAFSERRYERVPLTLEPGALHPPVTNSFNFPKLVTSLALIQGNYRGNARL